MAEALALREVSVELGARTVLRALSWRAEFGQMVAILGPNGAGKTTLLRALCGLVPYRGEIALEGVALAALAPEERARRVSFVPQQSLLGAALSVREVVSLGRYAHRIGFGRPQPEDARAIAAAMRDTDVSALAERAFSDLSTGEQKRVLLARALCTGAHTLLLDEPSAALDIEHALRLFELLQALARAGRAIVLVLHQLEHALAYCDRALLLRDGALLASGPTRELVSPENVRALYGVELVPAGAPGFRLPREAAP